MKCPKCKGKNMVMVEYQELYDGWIEKRCEDCDTRVGRWSGRVLDEGETENPELRHEK